jgi:predicted RNA-binding protein YlxR (DUF448 family)
MPERTCVGCGAVQGKRDLVRIVRTPDGAILLDPTGKRNGRGAYVHRELACLERARGRLARALRVTPEAVAGGWSDLQQAFVALLQAPPARRGPVVHRAPVPLPPHLIARGMRGPTRTPSRRGRPAGPGEANGVGQGS